MGLERTKLVIFDMDGLLLDTERLIAEHWERIALQKGLDWDKVHAACMASIGINLDSVRRVAKSYFGEDFDLDGLLAEVHASIDKELQGGPMPVKKGAFELLEYLKRTGMPAVVASSSWRHIVEKELSDAGLLPYFLRIFGGEDAGRSKPAPDLFLNAAKAMGTGPADCLVLEDSYNGIRAAHAAGMMSVMVPDLLPVTDEMRQLYTAQAGELGEVAEMLLEAFLP